MAVDFARFFDGVQNIIADFVHDRGFVKQTAALKLQIEAAEIHVDGSDNGDVVVRDNHLFVQKARRVFVNLDARLDELGIKRAGHSVDELFVRNARRQNAHIDAGFGGVAQRGCHLVVQAEIRRCDVYAACSAVDDVQKDVFADVFVV